jgi:RNA polymerase sigma factor (sigma-70 family)
VLKSEGEERREFLRAIDAVKKRTQRARKWVPGSVETAPDHRGYDDRSRAEDREAVRHAARELLSDRQRRILQLSFEGWSVQEISDEMRLPADRVSDEKYKAVRKLQRKLATEAPASRARVGA